MSCKKILQICLGNNDELDRIVDEVDAHVRVRGEFSYLMKNLIIAGYESQKVTNVPRFDNFFKKKIRGKSVTRAYYDGDLNEQQICDMYMSAKKLLEEMYRSEVLQRIVGHGVKSPQTVSMIDGEIIR